VGGGLDNRSPGTRSVLTPDTLAANEATSGAPNSGANFANFDGGAQFENTIVADPRGGGANCANGESSRSLGYNLEDGKGCGFTRQTDLRNTDPRLGDLRNNGGPTRTRAIPASSPALDQGVSAGLKSDQRGSTRPVSFGLSRPPGGDGSDIGAFELQSGTRGRPACMTKDATIVAVAGRLTQGTSRSDVIAGTTDADRVRGRGGGDAICGRRASDKLRGQRWCRHD
jgi:hypothetical protein